MCFGGEEKQKETTTTTTIDPRLTQASLDNIKRLSSRADAGYQAYEGPRVADLTDQTQAGSDMISGLVGTESPYKGQIGDAYSTYMTSGPQQVSTVRAIDDVVEGGTTQAYMDPYLKQVLAPILQDLDEEAARTRNRTDAMATMAGAFGDSGWGFNRARDDDLSRRTRAMTIGDMYSKAYGDAMSRKTSDINRMLDVDKTNAGYAETALERALRGGTALTEHDRYNTGRTIDIARENQRSGQMQQQVDQAKLDAAYQEYRLGNIDEATMLQILNQAINGSPVAKNATGTEVVTAPDNSGWEILGTLAGTAAKAFIPV